MAGYHDQVIASGLRPPGFRELMRKIEQGAIDTLVIYSLSSMFTSAYATLNMLLQRQRYRVGPVVTDDKGYLTPFTVPVVRVDQKKMRLSPYPLKLLLC